MAPVQSINKHGFGHKFGLAFHHDHGVARSGEHDVEIAALQLLARGVDHKFAVHATDAATGNGAIKRKRREAHRGGSGGNAQHVGQILTVGGNDAGQHLHFVSVTLGKERTNRAVDQAGHQRFMVAGATDFAPEKVARDASGGIHLLPILHSKGEEVLGRFQRLFADRDQSHGAFALNPHRAVRLTRHAARFQNNFLAADSGGHSRSIQKTHINLPEGDSVKNDEATLRPVCHFRACRRCQQPPRSRRNALASFRGYSFLALGPKPCAPGMLKW